MAKVFIPGDISEDLAYLCGVFAGDGSINFRKNKNEYSLKCVGNPEDEQDFYNHILRPKFEKVFGVRLNMKVHDSMTTYGFSLYSKELCYFLTEKIGLPSGVKYDKLKVPELFLKEKKYSIAFIRGVFDTDGCISFKKRYRKYPYYPVISLSSKSSAFAIQIADILKSLNLKPVLILNYKVKDRRVEKGFTVINRIELNGEKNLSCWRNSIGFFSTKHLNKIEKYSEG